MVAFSGGEKKGFCGGGGGGSEGRGKVGSSPPLFLVIPLLSLFWRSKRKSESVGKESDASVREKGIALEKEEEEALAFVISEKRVF